MLALQGFVLLGLFFGPRIHARGGLLITRLRMAFARRSRSQTSRYTSPMKRKLSPASCAAERSAQLDYLQGRITITSCWRQKTHPSSLLEERDGDDTGRDLVLQPIRKGSVAGRSCSHDAGRPLNLEQITARGQSARLGKPSQIDYIEVHLRGQAADGGQVARIIRLQDREELPRYGTASV